MEEGERGHNPSALPTPPPPRVLSLAASRVTHTHTPRKDTPTPTPTPSLPGPASLPTPTPSPTPSPTPTTPKRPARPGREVGRRRRRLLRGQGGPGGERMVVRDVQGGGRGRHRPGQAAAAAAAAGPAACVLWCGRGGRFRRGEGEAGASRRAGGGRVGCSPAHPAIPLSLSLSPARTHLLMGPECDRARPGWPCVSGPAGPEREKWRVAAGENTNSARLHAIGQRRRSVFWAEKKRARSGLWPARAGVASGEGG